MNQYLIISITPPQLHESQQTMKREPSACGCNWATLLLREISAEIWPSRLSVGYNSDDLDLQNKFAVAESREVQIKGSNLINNMEKSSKEDYSSKMAVFPMLMLCLFLHLSREIYDNMKMLQYTSSHENNKYSKIFQHQELEGSLQQKFFHCILSCSHFCTILHYTFSTLQYANGKNYEFQ